MTDQTSAPDVVIVGGGIYGTSLAYDLAVKGRSVTLLEADDIACGASGGPGERGVRANRRDIRELPVVALALERWAHFEALFEGGVGYRRTGGMQVFDVPFGSFEHEVFGQQQAMAEVQTAMGVPSFVLTPDEMFEREPLLARGLKGAVFCPNDGSGDHGYATRAFAREAAVAGAVIRTGAKVAGIVAKGGEAVAVELEGGETVPVGGQLVLLCNGGVPALLKPHLDASEHLPVWNLWPQMHYVTNPRGLKLNHLLSHAQRQLAIKQLPDGAFMLSGGASVMHRDGYWNGSLSALAANVQAALHTVPALNDSSYGKVDASRFDTVAVDVIPIVDRPKALANTIFGFGWSGHGFAISLGFTRHFTDWLETGEKPAVLDPFRVSRFIP